MLHSIYCWILVGIALGCSVTVSAQTSCRDNLAQAQSHYISGAFSEVEAMLEPCLQLGRLGEDDRVRAYRLLALSALQQGRLIEAKIVALSLLSLRPNYEPDPTFDPPSYADLIHTVRSQLAVSRPTPVVEVDTSRIPPLGVGPEPVSPPVARQPVPFVPVSFDSPARGRRPGRVELSYWSGAVSFTGDFYRKIVVNEYLTSDGPRLGLQSAYVPASWVAIGLSVEGSYHAKFPAQRRVDDQPGIRTEAIVGMATVDVRLRAWSGSLISPYMSTGVSVVAARMLDETRYGVGPSVALGLDLAPMQGLSVFTEASATFPLPEDAIDTSPRQHGDVFSGFRLGLRSRIGR